VPLGDVRRCYREQLSALKASEKGKGRRICGGYAEKVKKRRSKKKEGIKTPMKCRQKKGTLSFFLGVFLERVFDLFFLPSSSLFPNPVLFFCSFSVQKSVA
jgi:hypothetical protein